MIEIVKMNKAFGEKRILSDFNLKIAQGEMLAIRGASGRGKSTLLHILGFLEAYDSGNYSFEAEAAPKINSNQSQQIIREKIAYLFQNFALLDSATVETNLYLAMRYVKLSKIEKGKAISQMLEELGLKGYEKRKIYELSGGEQQRVALARAMLKPSELLLCDEPTGSLDKANKNKIIDLLQKFNERGKTIVIVTHDAEIAASCKRGIEL